MSTTGGKRRFRLSWLSPDSGLYKSTEMSAECTLKDVKYSPLLCCSPFFLFNLTISLSLSPDCIRIDCNLSKCLLCSIYCTMIMSTYTVHCGTTITCRLLRFFVSVILAHSSPCLLFARTRMRQQLCFSGVF